MKGELSAKLTEGFITVERANTPPGGNPVVGDCENSAVHNFGNCIQNLIVTTSASGRTVCYFLNVLENRQYIRKA
ncbi:MAG: hypothetical protein PUA84_08220, partial [Oscillospiraceae bacterium]|nr:hypothetical protein [Oscillospiraceae bacterium]